MGNDNYICRDGKCVYSIEANWIESKGDNKVEVKLGLLASDLKAVYAELGRSTAVVEFYNIVHPHLIMAEHIFKGLSRHLDTDGNHRADKVKREYTWKPKYCYEYDGKNIIQKDVPDGYVFQVFVSPNINKHKEEWPEFTGWIDRWCWVKEDKGLQSAPVNWLDRYDEYLGKLHKLTIIK